MPKIRLDDIKSVRVTVEDSKIVVVEGVGPLKLFKVKRAGDLFDHSTVWVAFGVGDRQLSKSDVETLVRFVFDSFLYFERVSRSASKSYSFSGSSLPFLRSGRRVYSRGVLGGSGSKGIEEVDV